MKLHVINTGYFKLDGGAMFGVVPKALWSRTNPADSNNLCSWAMRSLLIEDGKRLMLIDCGIGNKQTEKFFSHYHLHGDVSLDISLAEKGFHRDDITDVFLTHLHFDHCGGAIEYDQSKDAFRPAFKNAHYWSNESHWKWATEPNKREKASFLSENILPLMESGQLNLLNDDEQYRMNAFPDIDLLFVYGHTEAQMIPHLMYKDTTVVFMADLLPSIGHIPLPYVMGYDTRPLRTLEEKDRFLQAAVRGKYTLFFQHDPVNECCTLEMTEKGVRLKETFPLYAV
jgi:glyoxylase-like metal-dependent hydrolase (beta-lactamase superfamily II)